MKKMLLLLTAAALLMAFTVCAPAEETVTLTSAEYREGQSGVQGRYEVTKTAGAVTEGACYTSGLEGTWQVSSWFTFEYTEIETTPARYAQMINSFFMGSGNSYYNYNWY